MAVGFPTKANWAAGDILTAAQMDDLAGTVNTLSPVGQANGSTLVADSSTSTGLRYTAGTVQSNPVLNSAFQIWQRGTSFTGASPYYCADRWTGARGGAVAGATWSRQVTGDTTNLPNIQYCIRISRTAGNTSTAILQTTQSFETINSIPFAGKTVTLSYYARKGANYSGGTLAASILTGTGTDENALFGYTGSAVPVSTGSTLTTTWQRFTISGTIATTATEMAVDFQWTPTGTAGAADYVDITGVQIDIGSVALPFRTYAGTLQGELAACQRYYWRFGGDQGNQTFGSGNSAVSGTSYGNILHPVPMRVPATSLDYSLLMVNIMGLGATAVTSAVLTSNLGSKQAQAITLSHTGWPTGTTSAGSYLAVIAQSTSSYLGFSAEL